VADLGLDKDLANKIATIIRLLASDKAGEAAAAAEALPRVLQSAGADVINGVAERVETDNKLSETEMQEIFDAGVEAGLKRGGQESRKNGGAPQFPSARDMAMHCYQHIDDLDSDWEREFVTNMASWTRRRPLSVKQQDKLETIYLKLGGRT